ncbi:MAG TPA: GNAT family N-acetyltransferase [Pyrinomonadaceae bacterium]|nr:GNAT family N-acetyltransferase [Pyrinomonadaceae bacterium]
MIERAVEIRQATATDASVIALVLLQAFAEYRSSYTDAGFSATTPDAEQVKLRLTEGPVWVALLAGEIVGTVAAVREADSIYVRGMAVLPDSRGHRIGELLLRETEAFAVSQNCARLFLSTTPFLYRAIALYEHHGYQRVTNGEHDLHGTPLFYLEKFIGVASRKES